MTAVCLSHGTSNKSTSHRLHVICFSINSVRVHLDCVPFCIVYSVVVLSFHMFFIPLNRSAKRKLQDKWNKYIAVAPRDARMHYNIAVCRVRCAINTCVIKIQIFCLKCICVETSAGPGRGLRFQYLFITRKRVPRIDFISCVILTNYSFHFQRAQYSTPRS